MAKELPYFQFEPAEYLTGDISFCSLEAQGLFINICAYYWQRNCELTIHQIANRFQGYKDLNEVAVDELLNSLDKTNLFYKIIKQLLIKAMNILDFEVKFKELVNSNIIIIKDNKIIINFLDEQKAKIVETSKRNSINGAKGGKVSKRKTSERLKVAKPKVSETEAIREEKIKEDKIKLNNTNAYDFLKSTSIAEIEAFEMQNKKSFENYDKFIEYFNNKVNFEEIEFTPNKLLSRLKILNSNWEKNLKTKNKKPTQNLTF